MQKDITPLAVGAQRLHPSTAELVLELDAPESLVRGWSQCAQGCGVGFRQGLSGSRAQFLSWALHRLFPCGRMGSGVLSFMENSTGFLSLFGVHMKVQSSPEHPALATFPNALDLSAALWVIQGGTLRGTRQGERLIFSNWTVESVG